MKIVILGAAGFIGTNLSKRIIDGEHEVTLVDEKLDYFDRTIYGKNDRVRFVEKNFHIDTDYSSVFENADVVYHLFSSINTSSSNTEIAKELTYDVLLTVNILEQCVKYKVRRIVFFSSGGTVYGETGCPICEEDNTNPITTYGIQKLTIEKIIFLYHYLYSLDYRIIRLSNPYGPHQRPNGKLGVVVSFLNAAMHNESLIVYGDGAVVRDYLYIDDAITAIINISLSDAKKKMYNVGSGTGVSIKELICLIEKSVGKKLIAKYTPERKVDVKTNFLNIDRYRSEFGELQKVSLEEGIEKTYKFLAKKEWNRKNDIK